MNVTISTSYLTQEQIDKLLSTREIIIPTQVIDDDILYTVLGGERGVNDND